MRFQIPFFDEDEINMAPMIDMVFLLLIFFMVASHMTKMDRTPVDLPVANQSIIPEQTINRTLITVKSLDEEGEEIDLFMNLKKININELNSKIIETLKNNPEVSICLRVDRFAKHKHVKSIMKICGESGISDVIFATFESGE